MKNRKLSLVTILLIGVMVTWFFYACAPVREFMHWKSYNGNPSFNLSQPGYVSTKKSIILIADTEGTEIFDLLAPYYLFSATEQANVYVVAEKKAPVIIRKGFFLIPHFSFEEFDRAGIQANVIVIPNLSAMDSRHQNPVIVNWIKNHYNDSTVMLSVCDGALTAAATGIYDGMPLTAHASDYESIRKQFAKPRWVNDKRVTHHGGLYSTAGVSNATAGALAIIDTLFGRATMLGVSNLINYTTAPGLTTHNSIPISLGDKLAIGRKVLFEKNRKVGVLLQDGDNELELAAILDTYNRTFPKSLESITLTGNSIRTKYGLTLLPTTRFDEFEPDELHVLHSSELLSNSPYLKDPSIIVRYNRQEPLYIIDECLDRITSQYGRRFTKVVKRLLDYN
ncbi:DJ-1/PfpI family protein [Chitinophaga sp. Hz27]|uniref:DJ-1/PfpI family protein n=1 Tax=Chitinophaga sp. Hz27 TaxID=3347169 RepID=UPI0035E16974